jgi:hypothetical protein
MTLFSVQWRVKLAYCILRNQKYPEKKIMIIFDYIFPNCALTHWLDGGIKILADVSSFEIILLQSRQSALHKLFQHKIFVSGGFINNALLSPR